MILALLPCVYCPQCLMSSGSQSDPISVLQLHPAIQTWSLLAKMVRTVMPNLKLRKMGVHRPRGDLTVSLHKVAVYCFHLVECSVSYHRATTVY